jgi:ribonuclease G
MKKILISVNPWQTRAAITKNDRLQNIYFEAHTTEQLERSFYKGFITKIIPGIQTAFVEIGQDKAGFLHISEIDRELALARMQGVITLDEPEEERKQNRAPLDISKILKEGEPILVQVSKEPVYEKGAKLTTCFTLPGRFMVLLPNIPRVGISKKIEEREERDRLREILKSNLPPGMGAIIRTSSVSRGEKEIKQDLNYLLKEWDAIREAFNKAEKKDCIHKDIPLSLAVIRDNLDEDVESVITNDQATQQEIYRFIKNIAPEYSHKVKLFSEPPLLFAHYNIEKQIDTALQKKTYLKSGGSIIIETTEAMTVIDVNTGKYTGKTNPEDTILQTNLEAADEIVRQLRLRNIGGLIVIDFIDMASSANRQKLYRVLEQTLRENDKYQSVVLKVSEFGLVQMTRKRSGKTLVQQLTETCATCYGRGFIKSIRTLSFEILRQLKTTILEESKKGSGATLVVHSKIFEYLTHVEFDAILNLEKELDGPITIVSSEKLALESHQIILK